MKAPASGTMVGPWAKEKLDSLQRYLDFYTKVLKNQRWRTLYVDAYAGGGRAVVRTPSPTTETESLLEEYQIDADQAALINGSPRIALDIANSFDRYVFIEPDPDRIAELEALRTEYAGLREIDVRHENAAAGIQWLISRNISRRSHRGIAFLDPFGAGLEWSIVEALAATGFFEVVINFALNMAILRMLPNSAVFQPGWREKLDAYFGTMDWYEEVYTSRQGLLGNYLEKRDHYSDRLLEFYRRRLGGEFGFVSQAKLIRNTRGAPLYYLLWAGPNKKGLEGANYILSMGETLTRRVRSRSR
jgi:three-Cys-motif partner protein